MRTLAVVLKDDYGIVGREESYEHRHFVPALREYGEVEVFDFGGRYLEDTERLQSDLIGTAARFEPDLIFFVLYQDQIRIDTLDSLTANYRTLNWFCDDQWRLEGFSRVYAPHFTHVITTDPIALDRYHELGIHNVLRSQWACGPMEQPNEPSHGITFVGMQTPNRKFMVDFLAANDILVECFGTGWPNGRVSWERMGGIFAHSEINLNLSNSQCLDVRLMTNPQLAPYEARNPKVREQVKGRHFEIAACGGFQLTPYAEFLEDYFDIGAEIAVFGKLDELPAKIRYYQKRDITRQSIAAMGRKRAAKHTYSRRFQNILTEIGMEVSACQT